MASSAAPDPFRAPRPGGLGQGLGLSMLSHGLLVGALALGMWWRREEPVGTTAELWAAVPEAATPRGETPPAPSPAPAPAPEPAPAPVPPAPPPPPPPEPPPREAEIAEQAPPPKPAPAPPPKPVERPVERPAERPAPRPDRSAEAARELAAQREANLERLMREAGGAAPSSQGTAAREAGPSATYAGLIKGRVKPNIIFPPALAGDPQAEVEVRAAPDGTIISRRLVRPSGSAAWDEAVLRAIDRTAVLPKDVDGRVPSTLILSFRPQD